ncbi:MAG: hypothetical protein QM655_12615 [Nocardioidaceae bacterium]
MSVEVREALAAAASSLDGVTCTPYYRQSTKTGDAWVHLASRAPGSTGFGYVDTWQVVVVLPQDLVAAEKWLDVRLSELLAALEPELVITTVTPTELALPSASSVNAVLVVGAREA